MATEPIRLGGMALANGVLVHGPRSWACAVRAEDGRLLVEADLKRFRATDVRRPLLRGPARLLEAFAILPTVRRRLPQARLPFERPAVLAAMAVGTALVHAVRSSQRISPGLQELVGAAASLAPAALALRDSDLAAYHGAEHISIGTYEHGELREKEHERCGSHLVGPLLTTLAAGNMLTARLPERQRRFGRVAASIGAVAASTEIFNWMSRNRENPLAKALSRPGHELQHRFATAEPTAEQLEVAQAALDACLELEHDGRPDPR